MAAYRRLTLATYRALFGISADRAPTSTEEGAGQRGSPVTPFSHAQTPSQQKLPGKKGDYEEHRIFGESGTRAAEYVERINRSPVQTTSKRNLALAMGKLTAEDVINSLASSQCIQELVPLEVR